MTKPYDVIANQHDDFDDWAEKHKITNGLLGANGSCAVMGKNKYDSAISMFALATGRKESEDISGVEAVKWGLRLEDPIAQAWAEETGKEIVRCGDLRVSKKVPWACSTPDYEVAGENADLQIKNVNAWAADDFEDGIPDWLYWNLQHEMLVSGHTHIYYACLLGGNNLKHGQVERDANAIAAIITTGSDFWARVQRDDPPLPDGSDASTEAIKDLYSTDDGTVVELDIDVVPLDEELQEIKKVLKTLGKRKAELENIIKAKIGFASKAVLPGGAGTYSFKTVHKSGGTRTYQATSYRVLRRGK